MAACLGRGQRMVHQRRADAEAAARRIDGQGAKHQRCLAPGADMPEPDRADQPALMPNREGEAFRGQPSVAQALARAGMARRAKAHIQQRFARGGVGATFRTDRERGGCEGQGNAVVRGGRLQSSHGMSFPTPLGGVLSSNLEDDGMGAGEPAPGISGDR
jgi:hypothetical protein